jgi:hypothetical protein
MFQPRRSALIALLFYPALFRSLPFVLSRLGLNISPEAQVYLWGLTPVLAFGMFSTAHLRNRTLSLALPLLGWLLGDVLIRAARSDWGFFYPGWYLTYLAFLSCCLAGTFLRRGYNLGGSLAACAGGSISFFIISNFGSWVAYYPQSWEGLTECYVSALPFFRPLFVTTMLTGGLLFTAPARRFFFVEESAHPVENAAGEAARAQVVGRSGN